MPEGFEVARGYVEVVANIERDQVRRSARVAGDEAGDVMGDRITRGIDGRLRDDRGRYAASGREAGKSLGAGMGRSAGHTLGGVLSGHLPTIFSNPYIIAAAATAGALLAPAIGAGIAGGIIGGAGLGAIAGGIALIADDPRVIKSAGNLKNRFLTVFKDAAKPMVAPTLEALSIFGRAIDRIGPKIGAMFDKLSKSGAIEGLANGIVGLVENALPGMLKLVEASGPFLKSLGPGLAELGKGIGYFAEQIAKAGPDAAIFFGDLFKFLSGQIAMWGAIIRGLSVAYTAMRSFFTSIPGWVTGAISAVRGWWDALWARGVAVVAWLSALPGRIGGFIGGIASAVVARGAAILGWFAALPGRIWGFISSLPARARALFAQMFDAIMFAIGFGIGTVIKLVITMPGKIVAAMSSLRSRMLSVISQAWSAAKASFTAGVTAVVGFALALPGRVYSAAIGLVGRVRSIFTQARSTATSTASALVSGVVGLLRSLPGKAASALSSFASRVAGALRATIGAAHSIGAAIIRGVISGINSMIGAAVSAAQNAVGNIIDGAQSALGIGSPSKVMAREVGRWMLPGLTQGMQATIPAARRAAGAAVASVVPAMQGGPRSAGSVALSGSETGATYYFAPGSVVLDASRIASIEDLLKLIKNIQGSARSFHARTATAGGAR